MSSIVEDETSNLSNLDAPDLVKEVLRKEIVFKAVASELRKRPASREAATLMIDAYLKGDAPPWLTALLLGACRDPIGYATVREILLAAPRQSAESYAGIALARINGRGALADLMEIMSTAPERRSREGAAFGLEHLELPEAAPAILDAALSGKIKWDTAGSILGRTFPDESMVVALLEASDEKKIRLAAEIIDSCLRGLSYNPTTEPWPGLIQQPGLKLLEGLARVLDDPAISMAPGKREALNLLLNCKLPAGSSLRKPSSPEHLQAITTHQMSAIAAAERRLNRTLTERERRGLQSISSIAMLEAYERRFNSPGFTDSEAVNPLEYFARLASTE